MFHNYQSTASKKYVKYCNKKYVAKNDFAYISTYVKHLFISMVSMLEVVWIMVPIIISTLPINIETI